MSGDEFAGLIFKEQGFLVVQSRVPRNQGDILRPAGVRGQTDTIPLVIRSESNIGEFIEQNLKAALLFGMELEIDSAWPYFYRAEAAD